MWPALISAGASLVGGALGAIGQSSARQAAQDQFNQNIAQQREFATTALQWRAGDAMKAYAKTGIHPLALLGVQGPSYTPVSYQHDVSNPMGAGIAQAGQDISRSILATQSKAERLAALEAAIPERNLRLEHMRLQNLLLASQIARMSQTSMPAMPVPGRYFVDGQGNTPAVPEGGMIKLKPQEVTPTSPNFPGQEPGVNPTISWHRSPRGGFIPVPSENMKQKIEDMGPLGWQWWYREHVTPAFSSGARNALLDSLPKAPLGKMWNWDSVRGEATLVDRAMPRGKMNYRRVDPAPWNSP